MPSNTLILMNFHLLPFPLNVYGQTLALECGPGDAQAALLHFGLFDAAAVDPSDYHTAQLRAQALLQSYLLPAPASVLEWGFGSGALARSLGALGYRVVALSCTPEELRHVTSVSCADATDDVQFHCAEFGQWQSTERFDIMVLEQSAQYLDPLSLLTRARELLRSGGQLLIVDEFLLDDQRRVPEPRPLLAHFLQLAERCGITLERQLQLGKEVAPGLKLFQELLHKHRAALAFMLKIDEGTVDALSAALDTLHEKFVDGRLGYSLLDLRCGAQFEHEVVYGSIDSFTADEIRPVFESSFDARFDPAVWHWKYGTGRGRAVCARVDGLLVGHYGGAPRDIRFFGEPNKAIQICDVMVMPEYRSFANRDTLFFKTAATFLEQHIGNAAEHLLGFGFPNKRVLQMAQRLGLYETTDSFIELHYASQTEPVSADFLVTPFALDEAGSRDTVDALWEQMAHDLRAQIVGVRDHAYLQYRYCSHPSWASRGYECVALRHRDTGALAALAILKKHEGGRLLMDIIGPLEGIPTQLRALVAYLSESGAALCCRITNGHARHFTLPGCELRDLGIEIPCNSWTRGPQADELKGAWWLTAGDMDFL
jgi:cyclopropane fatty-acyl-phospholipid synthase-like methyltransferase